MQISMPRFRTVAACVSIALPFLTYHSLLVLQRHRPTGNKGTMATTIIAGVAMVGSLFVIPWLMGVPERPGSRPGRLRWQDLLVMALIVLGPASRCLGMELWITSPVVRNVISVSVGFGTTVGYCLFFTETPRKHRGLLFGLAAGFGPLASMTTEFLAQSVGPEKFVGIGYTIVHVISFVIAAAQLAGYVAFRKSPPPENETAEETPARSVKERRTLLFCLLGSAILFTMLNTFQRGRYYPNMDTEMYLLYPWMSLWVVILSPVFGYLMDRDLPTWFRRLIRPCAITFMIIPVMPLLDEQMPLFTSIVQHLATVASYIIFVGVTVAVDRVAKGRWLWCIVRSFPHLTRWPLFIVFMVTEGKPMPFAAVMLLSTLAAVAFYEMIGFQTRTRISLPQTEKGTPDGETENPDPAPAGINLEELFTKFGLTNRESEVAALLLQGLSTTEMADKLFISEVTVNFHVKNILAKFGAGSRRAFQAGMLAGKYRDAAPKPVSPTRKGGRKTGPKRP